MIPYFLLALGLFILLLGGKFLVDGASALATRLGMSPGLIGLTIVAFGTSAPELLVSVNAALKGSSDISIGNVVGSNIANIGLFLGISCLFYPIVIRRQHLRFDYLITVLATLIFFGLSYNGQIGLGEGVFLFSLFIVLNLFLFRKVGSGIKEEKQITDPEVGEVKNNPVPLAVFFFLAGIVGLYFGSELFVNNSMVISRSFGISERIIGITVVAIGTSIPELITSIIAAISKKTDLAIGNILGSNIMNILSIIGITALIHPIQVSEDFLRSDYLWMIGITLLLFPLMKTKMRISKVEGTLLLVSYVVYMYFLL
jgi:cation:H+ antiporter